MARTDNDTWDLASSVGATATGVAASRALASRGPDAQLDDPFAEPLVRAVGVDFFIRMASGDLQIDDDDSAFSEQRMAEGIVVRTRFFDDFFTGAAESGIRQAVILASGLDARAYRLAWPAGSVVFEVDQPQVIDFKTRTLAEIGAAPTADRRPIGIDLRDDWPTALREHGFDTTQPTAWIAEGLLIYLPSEAQDRLFDNITALSAPGSRVATEHVPDPKFLNDERAQQLTQRWRKHGYDLDMSELFYQGDRNSVIEYLSRHGWAPTARTTQELYADNGFDFPEDATMAAFGHIEYVSATLK
ncbi:MAG: SAM-dependent methyltransferase [Mycobacterium sp.]|nr:SAM-dependent methyltransferase [Mycobacterium sp.]